jgi:MarR family transcriptional regulator, transcriptional regulator for hemolysin
MATPDLMFLLSQANHALTTELTARLAELNLTPRSHCVLRTAATGGDRTQSRIAEECGLDKTTMVVTVDELEAAGYAQREVWLEDRRVRFVAVTPMGARASEEADAIVAQVYDDVLADLPADERAGFLAALDRLGNTGGRLSMPVACERQVRRPRVSAAAPGVIGH